MNESIHKLDHVKSKCCNEIINFQTTSNGYTINVWCSKCNNYLFTGRIETLISLWFGNLDAVIKNKGYLPKLYKNLNKAMSKIQETVMEFENNETDF